MILILMKIQKKCLDEKVKRSLKIMNIKYYLKIKERVVAKILYDSYHGLFFGSCTNKDSVTYRIYEDDLDILKLKILIKLKELGYNVNIMENEWIS